MSVPSNPLDQFDTYSVKHMLVAFKYTTDAEQTNIVPTLGVNPGDRITGASGGPGVIIVNEFSMTDFQINSARWTWNFYGPLTKTCGSCIGYVEITDRTGLHFIDFIKTKVTQILGVSEGHIVFVLRSFFLGNNFDNVNNDILVGNPLVFNMVTLADDLSPSSGRFYVMSFVGASTTFGQLNQYSKIYQMDITHADGALHKNTPVPNVATCGTLTTRKQEDALQNGPRKTRIDKSKPMKTLKEIFQAFEAELNQQKFTNAAQLQSWLQHVNDDYSVKIVPPIQLENIPVDFFVRLDPAYNDYPVDNRNLPFEQPEQDQNKKGIRCFPIKTATDIPIAVEKLMKLSRKVGQESALSIPYIFKTTISAIRTTNDRYQIYVVIRKIQVPINEVSLNSGPGNGAINPLQFSFQDPKIVDHDIISIKVRESSDSSYQVLETQTQDTSALVVFGDREQITVERTPLINYFQSQYSGLRAMINPYENYGLEYGTDASELDRNTDVRIKQKTHYSIVINGNPYLLNDVNRLPSDVANSNAANAHYYKFTESEPMYAKLSIYLKSQAGIGIPQDQNENVNNKFYFDNWLHLGTVTNIFESGLFLQQLDLLRHSEMI
jgi:hypothetical protein